MAVADGRLTGRPGIAMVSRTGRQQCHDRRTHRTADGVPMILLIGQIPKCDLRAKLSRKSIIKKCLAQSPNGFLKRQNRSNWRKPPSKPCAWPPPALRDQWCWSYPKTFSNNPREQPVWKLNPQAPTLPDRGTLHALEEQLRHAKRPLIIAGGMFEQDASDASHRIVSLARGIFPLRSRFAGRRPFRRPIPCMQESWAWPPPPPSPRPSTERPDSCPGY